MVVLVTACGAPPKAPELPPPIEATTIGVGDVFEVRIVGEDKLPTMFTVAPDGTVDLPYVKRVKVEGLEPQEIQEIVRAKLVERQLYTDPSVSIAVKEYNSKRIEVLGEVQKPGSIPLQPGMTLLRAIALAGGFNSVARKGAVTLRRKLKGGQIKAVTISVDAIIENKISDIPLQAGDSIFVPQTIA
jgi:polysaccharide export outer membrane protein